MTSLVLVASLTQDIGGWIVESRLPQPRLRRSIKVEHRQVPALEVIHQVRRTDDHSFVCLLHDAFPLPSGTHLLKRPT